MVNRFDRPYGQDYVSTYIPLPFQELSAVAARIQDKNDRSLEDIAKTQSLIKINADPKNRENRDLLLNDYNNELSDIAADMIKNGVNQSNQLRLNTVKNKFVNDPRRLQLESNHLNYQKYQKDIEDLKKSNKYDKLNATYDPYEFYNTPKGEVKAFDYTGAQSTTDYYKPAKEMMASIKASGYDKGTYDFDDSGNVIGKKRGWEGVLRKDVQRVAAAKTPLFLQHEDSRYFVDKFLHNNPEATKIQLYDAAYNYLVKEGENQIFGKSSSDTDFKWAPQDIRDKKAVEDAFKMLPVFEGNVDPNSISIKQALQSVGVNTAALDDKGEVTKGLFEGKEHVANLDKFAQDLTKRYNEGKMVAEDYNNQLAQVIETRAKAKGYENNTIQKYTDLVKVGFNYGILGNHKNKDGSIDYAGLEQDLINIGKSIGTQASSIQGMQVDFGDKLSRFYFGENKGSGDNAYFAKSPMVNKLTIYEQGNPNSQMQLEEEGIKSKLAENAKFIGYDFNDPNNGALSFTSTMGKEDKNPRLYNAVTSDKVTKKLMEPVHNFTQDFNRVLNNNYSYNDKVKSQNEAQTIISDYNKLIQSSPYDSKIKEALINSFNQAAGTITNNKNIVVGNTGDGRHSLIGTVDFSSGEPNKVVLKIDNSTGQFEVVTLGDIQHEESTMIQMQQAPAYNQKSPGYIPKDVIYE